MSFILPSLPVELYHEIAAQVEDASTLAALCRVSRTWNVASTKHLYRGDVDIFFHFNPERTMDDTWTKPSQLQRTILTRPDLAALVKSVRIKVVPFDSDGSDADFRRLYNEATVAVDVLNSIFEADRCAIVGLSFVDTDDWLLDILLDDFLVFSSRLPHLQRLQANQVDRSLQALLMERMSSLLHLDIDTMRLNDLASQPPPFALRSLTVQLPLSNDDVLLLADSPTRTSLESIKFSADLMKPPSWARFPNLKLVDLLFDQTLGEDVSGPSLATCVAAETITLRLPHINFVAFALESTCILYSLPSSLVSLDLSPIKERLSEYVLDWLRDGDARWPNLRRVKMRGLNSRENWHKCPQFMEAQHKELEEVRSACEEVGQRRGIVFEWTEC